LSHVHQLDIYLYESQKTCFIEKISEKKRQNVEKNPALEKLIQRAIVIDGRTFNDFEKTGLREVINYLAPKFQMPSRRKLASNMKTVYRDYKTK
jgi:hypothetical protein